MSSNKTNDMQNILFSLHSDFQCKMRNYMIYKMSGLNLLVWTLSLKGEDAAVWGSSCKDERMQFGLCDFVLSIRSTQKTNIA